MKKITMFTIGLAALLNANNATLNKFNQNKDVNMEHLKNKVGIQLKQFKNMKTVKVKEGINSNSYGAKEVKQFEYLLPKSFNGAVKVHKDNVK